MSQLLVKVKHLVEPTNNYDWISKNDLFVLVRYGLQSRRTNVYWDDNNPHWNETFLFDFNRENDEIIVELYDDNLWSSIKNIIKTSIPVEHDDVKEVVAGIVVLEMGDPYNAFYETIKNGDKIIKEQTQIVEAQKQQIETQEQQLEKQKEHIGILQNKQDEIIKILAV